MCGLAALLSRDGGISPDWLESIRDAMTARGPDGSGSWISPGATVGLGHRRLAIIDLTDSGAQPMSSADGRLRVVFNGEIYNYPTLRKEAEAAGWVFHSNSDTEVLLALYRQRGEAMLPALRGMFAFALWDADRRGLLLARDPFGIKPLYISDDGRTLQAASQVKALLAGGRIDARLDPAGHVGFFLWGHVPEPHTLYRGIRALPAGTWLWAGEAGDRAEGRFFDLREEMAAGTTTAGSLRAALLDSVRAHLIADVPVGIFLSGGLDSTTLTALATEAGAGRLSTITLGFGEYADTARDEVPLAEIVATHYGTDHVTRRISGGDFAEAKDKILTAMDQPSVDGINTWLVARAAKERGLKVALSGLGGDELFGGYDTFSRVPRMRRMVRPFGIVRGLGKLTRVISQRWIGRVTSPKAAGILELGGSWGGSYLLRRGLFMPWELSQVLDSDVVRDGWRQLAPLMALDDQVAGLAGDRRKVAALEMAFYMRNQLLRDADWAGMAHSLEIRVPLVDPELFRSVVGMIGHPPSKLDMAAAARPPLPQAVLSRAKTGFFVPIMQWLGEPNLRSWAKTVYRAQFP